MKITPSYQTIHTWESYSQELSVELAQTVEEGKDIDRYADVIRAVSKLPRSEEREKFADIIFDIILNAPQKPDYPYVEPSDLDGIRAVRPTFRPGFGKPDSDTLYDKIYGAWVGRICGCLLGKPVEGARTNELQPFLKDTGNFPMKRYIFNSDITDEIAAKYHFPFKNRCYPDTLSAAPVDDDTNYTVLASKLIERYGVDFTPDNMKDTWIALQSKNAYCTAERVAFRNFIAGYNPPDSAIYKNPYREWIGAQIRGDYFGYINPGNPELAADMAWRDASISHIKNGIYGEMYIAAMLAAAAVESDIPTIITAGLGQIPEKSRLYEQVTQIIDCYKNGKSQEETFAFIHEQWSEYTSHGWCHTISNAMIVTAGLLYGGGDYGKSICMAVETGFDTDCNGATIGSILGMRNGFAALPQEWYTPIHDSLQTSIFGVGTVKISDMARLTLKVALR